MGRIVNFTQSNLLPLISALKENTEEGEYTIGMESNAPVGGEYYHVMDDEQVDISENTVISENSTDRRVNSIIKKYSGVSDFNEIRAIRSKILKLIPNARAKNEMYLGAVAMWYLTGCLNDTSDRFKLNYLLGRLHHGASFGFEKILGREDFNMVSFDTMKWIMDDIMPSEETAESYSSKGKIQKVGNYTIYRMDSYDDTKYVRSQLSQVHWCIFEDDGTFSYMSEGYTVYVCVRDGYENARMMSYDELVEKLLSHGMTSAVESLEENYPKDDMYDDFVYDIAGDDDETAELLFVNNEYELGLPPCDDYGLSMFVVMVSKETYKNGRIVMVYSRYNLPNMYDGNILSVSELSNVIGADAMSVFTPQGNVNESKDKKHTNIIIESQESKSIAAAKKLAMQRLNYNEQEADEFIRIKLRNDIPTLRTPQGGKFILGVTRMFCDGELRNANDIGNLNSTLKLVASDAHINEYDRNLNNLSCQELVQRFAKAMSDNLEAEKNEIGQMMFESPSDYDIVRIDSFEQAQEYGDYVSWCVTHSESMFNSYTNDGINQFYFCLKNDFENVEKVPSEGCPLDEYGLSMIAVSVNENGMLNTCTCRWNHDNGGDDSIMNAKEVSQVIGMNFFEVFKPNNKWKDLLTSVMQRLENGEGLHTIFDYVSNFYEGFASVSLNGKSNFINQEGKFLSDQWFDYAGIFREGFASVSLNGKSNFINQEGRFLSDQWFDYTGIFHEGFASVSLNGKSNFINQEGRLLSDQWFDDVYSFSEGLAEVKLNGKYNYINQEGRLLSDQWFDHVDDFHHGFAMVDINNKYNFINQEGRLLSDQWFDDVYSFSDKGFAEVELNGRIGKIDTNGNITLTETINKNKVIKINENQLKKLSENLEFEVDSSEVDLSSFKKQDSLPSIWKDEDTLDSKVRLKLLDIADDFWDYVDITWVEPKGIIITGSLCNYNWSDYSDVDLHLIVDFNEIDERTDFVKEYLDSKKNEWNEEHGNLKIYGYAVELYVQNIDEDVDAGGIYDLEENKWLRKPSYDDMEEIGTESDDIKEKAARVMTIIDDMWDYFNGTDDSHKLEVLGDDADNLWRKIKKMRTDGLTEDGEMSVGNIVYKYMRRKGYLDRLFDLRAAIYDKVNTITEGVSYDKFREGQAFRCSKLLTEWYKIDYFEKAKEYFGTTNDLNECGFILPDGEMLDLSSSKGRRGIPHRNVEAIGIGLESFIEHGAIRCDSRYKLINICKRPTKEQIIRLVEIIKANNGSVSLDLGNGLVTFDYVDYKNANYKRIINDIINFFDNKIKPSSLYESKNIIKEYLEKDYNLPLYKYFKWASTASSCEKARDLAYSCSYYIDEYIRKIYYRYSEFENLLNDGEFDYEDESLIEMFLNMLEENNLCDHFVSEMQNIVDYYELPSWCTMNFNRIVKNEWCIHFGSDSESIAKEGFTGGTPEIEHLAYTNAGVQKSSAGYDFAFLINDRNVDYNGYGDEAVIFRTSGVEIYHYGDNQNQVVFWGPNVKSFIPIHQDNGDWVVYGQNGQVLVRCGRPSEIALWATENLPQYRKQIMSGKNGYTPTMSYWDENERRVVRKPYPLYRNESIRKYLTLLKESSVNEEVVADGSANGNPYSERWKAEREALKNFISNFGTLMQSKEDNKEGRVYKVYYDKLISNLIGYNYCLCVQYDEVKNKPKSTVYVRAYDKFTPFIRRNLQFDDRGLDNHRGTADDIGNSYQPVQTKR